MCNVRCFREVRFQKGLASLHPAWWLWTGSAVGLGWAWGRRCLPGTAEPVAWVSRQAQQDLFLLWRCLCLFMVAQSAVSVKQTLLRCFICTPHLPGVHSLLSIRKHYWLVHGDMGSRLCLQAR